MDKLYGMKVVVDPDLEGDGWAITSEGVRVSPQRLAGLATTEQRLRQAEALARAGAMTPNAVREFLQRYFLEPAAVSPTSTPIPVGKKPACGLARRLK